MRVVSEPVTLLSVTKDSFRDKEQNVIEYFNLNYMMADGNTDRISVGKEELTIESNTKATLELDLRMYGNKLKRKFLNIHPCNA